MRKRENDVKGVPDFTYLIKIKKIIIIFKKNNRDLEIAVITGKGSCKYKFVDAINFRFKSVE